MKLVDREELMTMPPGTVYQQWNPCILGELMIKGETITDKADPPKNIDWYENPVGAHLDMNGHKFVLSNSDCREATFDPELRYLVFDAVEVGNIVARLQAGYERCPDERTLPFEI